MKITLLGTGTSQGVPVIGCNCVVCSSKNIKDKRTRSSILIEVDNTTIVIDTGPDFRFQMLANNVDNIDAILYTHHHKDHVAGLDDIRAYNHKWNKSIDIFSSQRTFSALKNEFPYIFTDNNYPGVPRVNSNIFNNSNFQINNIDITPIEARHYKMQVFGFRIRDFIYLTDVSYISENEKKKMFNAKLIVLDALRKKEHISHFNLDQAINLISEIRPDKALLTHVSHLMGLHDDVNNELPDHIQLAYDSQKIILKS